jgi:hypothetical protein
MRMLAPSGATGANNLPQSRSVWNPPRERALPVKKTIQVEIETDTVWIIHWRGSARVPRCQHCGPGSDDQADEPVATNSVVPSAAQRRLKIRKPRLLEAPGGALRACLASLRQLVQKQKGGWS